MFIDITITFTVKHKSHYGDITINRTVDSTENLFSQAKAECMDWIERKNRLFGQHWELICMAPIVYQYEHRYYTGLTWSHK